jgi:hypothetical protein
MTWSTLVASVLLILANAFSIARANETYVCAERTEGVLLFVDRTTPFDDIDKDILSKEFDLVVGSLRPCQKLSVYTIAGSNTSTQLLFNSRFPGCPVGESPDYLFGRCSTQKVRSDRSAFRSRVAATLRELLRKTDSHDRSEITQTISEITRTYSGDARIERIYIFSDLLENSRLLVWPKILSSKPASLIRSLRELNEIPAVQAIDVYVFGIGRSDEKGRRTLEAREEMALKLFWVELFAAGGAKSVRIQHRPDADMEAALSK